MNLKKALKISLISGVFIVILCAVFIYIKNRIESMTPLAAIEIFDLSHIPRYKNLIGQEFETQVDLVVLNENRDPDFGLLSPSGGIDLPLEKVKKIETFPYDHGPNTMILGILPKGSRVKISRIVKIRISKMGQPHDSRPRLQGEIISEGNFIGYKVFLHRLADTFYGHKNKKDVDTLSILKKFAVRVK